MIALVLGGCSAKGSEPSESRAASTQQALDAAKEIDAKWAKLGGAAVVGAATSGIQAVPGSTAEYERFANGVIVYSNDYGAVYLTYAIFDEWLALAASTTADGSDVFSYLGLPRKDYATLGNHDTASFEHGMIVAKHGGLAFPIYGHVFEAYLRSSDTLGLPTALETVAPGGGGRVQTFEQGNIYWKSGLGAFALPFGPITFRWFQLQGTSGALGYPQSDIATITDSNGVAIGAAARFEHGSIYYSATIGARYVRDAIASAYETVYGGPAGWLGFPISDDAIATSGDPYNDFQGGVLVDHLANDAWTGVVAFQSFALRLNRIYSGGSEGACGSVDLYAGATIDTPDGRVVDHQRWPADGDVGADASGGPVWNLSPVANSSISIWAALDLWDSDGGFCFGDEFYGEAVEAYSIDNLWGLLAEHDHRVCTDDGCGNIDFSLDHTLPYDPKDFRGQMWWSFHNFDTDELSYDQFANTFTDVGPDESGWRHPFNWLFYKLIYKGAAKHGNCFGMGLESIYAGLGQSAYSEPIHQYFPATQNGIRLTDPAVPAGSVRDSLINEINIKHGYQLGIDNVLWTIGMVAGGLTHDPMANYALLDTVAADHPLIATSDDYLWGDVHTLTPYAWGYEADSNKCAHTAAPGGCYKIHVADPNYPTGASSTDDIIEIDPASDEWHYRDRDGGSFYGDRLMVMPFRNFDHTPATPFADPISLIEDSVMFIAGDSGSVNQITDDQGRTLFEPGLAGPPMRWDQLRHDASARIPNLAPLMIDNGGAPNGQIFAATGTGSTYTYETLPATGVPAGASYEATFYSAKLAAYFSIPGTPGKPDRITASSIGTASRSVAFSVPADGVAKQVTLSLGGTEKQRWAELSGLTVQPAQKLTMRLDNGGYDLTIDNAGPPTSATLRVQAGPGASPVLVGTIQIPTGSSAVQYQRPETTIAVTGQVFGQHGWLVAPVTVTLTAKDYSSKGIAAVETSGDQATWSTYGGPFVYTNEGVTSLYYRARDNDGNVELPKVQELEIDTRPPVVAASTTQVSYRRVQPFLVEYTASDPAPGSGLDSSSATFDGQAVSNGAAVDLLWEPLGTHTVSATATDVAGWSAASEAHFELIATQASLVDLIAELRRRGEIDSNGVANSLSEKAQRNLNALLREIEAQAGKHLSVRGADLLSGDTQYVIAHQP